MTLERPAGKAPKYKFYAEKFSAKSQKRFSDKKLQPMNPENSRFRPKSKEELEAQLDSAEQHLGEPLVPKNEREASLLLPVEQLKERYPEQYQKYLAQLRLGNKQVEIADNPTHQTYTDEEINVIREALAGETQVDELLLNRVENDENLKRYSMAGFFPIIWERISQGQQPEVFILPTQGRKIAVKIAFSDQAYAVKTLENSGEKEIAKLADELQVGPRQFESIKRYLTEEFIEGNLISKLDPKICTPEFMRNLGRQIGEGIKKLHKHNIVINDQLLRDDLGKSHTMVSKSGDIRFIDFGAAVDLTSFPNLSEEQVWLLMRSDPLGAISLSMLSGDKLRSAMEKYRATLLENFSSKDELMKARDYQLMREGLSFLSHSLPNTASLAEGLKEVLKD
jgi:serine/threonine protein kinase